MIPRFSYAIIENKISPLRSKKELMRNVNIAIIIELQIYHYFFFNMKESSI